MTAESRQEVTQELRRRLAQRRSYLDFVTQGLNVTPAAHHRLIIDNLQALADGKITRLIINAPPGSAKSSLASVWFVAWCLAHLKQVSIIGATHTTELAERWGRKIRDIVSEHGVTLGTRLRPDMTAAGRFATLHGGEYLACGVGTAILGQRADIVVCDDVLRSLEDANSATVRRNLIDWFEASLRTRMKPGGRIAIIGTRLHEADLVGHLLEKMDKGGEQWTILHLPAIAEENDILGRKVGEYLWDDDPAWDYGNLLRAEFKAQTARVWASLYQQRPAPETGSFFEASYFRPIDKLPPLDTLRTYGASDFAVSAGRGDFTVHLVCGVDPDDRLYVLDVWRKQARPDEAIERMLDMAARYKPMQWGEESGQIRNALGPAIDRRAHERRVPIFRKSFPARHDKSTRCGSIRAKLALDGLFVNMKAHFWPAMNQELLGFPGAKHDDIADALGLIGQMVADMVPGQRRQPPKPKTHLDDYAEMRADLFQRDGESYDDFAWRELQTGQSGSGDVLC
jgi:predicted phage terminase large subunit-like protein